MGYPEFLRGQTGLACQNFSSDRLLIYQTWRNGVLERDSHSPRHFPAMALSASHVLKGIELLETAAEGGRRVFLSWGQAIILTPSSRNSEWHVLGSPYLWRPAHSLRLGCYGQPEAVSQSQSLPTLPSSTDGSRKKISASRRCKGDLWKCAELETLL